MIPCYMTPGMAAKILQHTQKYTSVVYFYAQLQSIYHAAPSLLITPEKAKCYNERAHMTHQRSEFVSLLSTTAIQK